MCIADGTSKAKVSQHAAEALQLNNIRKHLPERVFKKSLITSLSYMAFDYFMWFGTLAIMYAFVKSPYWTTLPFWGQAIVSFAYWNIVGFFMWCQFVVGHDCGHGTFSDYEWLNDILGHISHASIMVPFWPWQLSHRRHHMYHNHEDKDYSHPWYTKERMARPDEASARYLDTQPLIRATFPLIGWFVYLLSKPDGTHFFPFPDHRLWAESPFIESVKCVFSTIAVMISLAIVYAFCGDFTNMAFYYFGPLLVFGWWITTVTYLQHHDHSTVVYGDENWRFVEAAFETIDRTYGKPIDVLSHNITDGHVVHHLFFTKIPHYHLPEATAALQNYLKEQGLYSMYKFTPTYDFSTRVHQYFYEFGFRSQRAESAKKNL